MVMFMKNSIFSENTRFKTVEHLVEPERVPNPGDMRKRRSKESVGRHILVHL